MRKRWIYWDGPLAAFVTIMIAAVLITSHGVYIFYSYILPWELAIAATAVLSGGIPLLELAAVLDKQGRPRYIAGIIFLLGLESLAQYLQSQAGFVSIIQRLFPNPEGIDLATFAREPHGRLLPVLYLAALSGVVVYFGYAASVRIRDLRQMATAPAHTAEEWAALEQQLKAREQEVTELRESLHEERVSHNELRGLQDQSFMELDSHCQQLIRQLAESEQALSSKVPIDLLRVAEVLRQPRIGPLPWEETAALLGIPVSTLRRKVSSPNGKEVVGE